MAILQTSRPYEDIYFEDPATNPDTPRFRVFFDDASIEELLSKVSDAIERAQSLTRKIEEGTENRDELIETLSKLERRVICAFIGADGYQSLLEWMGEGKAIDPSKHTTMLGEVMATFLSMLGQKASNEQLRRCGLYFAHETVQAKELVRAQKKAKGKDKKFKVVK